jgi:TrfA protein
MSKQLLTSDMADIELAKRLESIGRTLAERTERERQTATAPAPQPLPPAKVVQLPLWPTPTRGTPNSFLRGALFAAIQGKERQAFKRELLATQKGTTIRFTGWQFDQSDLDVWEQAVQLAASHPLGNICHFHITAFLRALDRNTGKSDREWLKDAFARLAGCCVEITEGRYGYGGWMLEFKWDEIAGVYIVRLNPTILNLYKAGWTAIDWYTRCELRRKPLALWLHGYYATHAKPLPVKVDTLRSLSGSKGKTLRSYRQKLRRALDELKAIDAIASWQIDAADLVTVDRGAAITASQRRRLTRSKPRKNPKN